MSRIRIKRGSSFAPRLTYTPAADALESLEGVTITSSIKAGGRIVSTLTVQDVDDDFLSFTLSAEDGTDAWPTGMAEWDIRFAIGGVVFYSDTVVFEITSSVTPS